MPTKRNKLIDVLDDMNWKESTTNKMVIDKLDRLIKLIYGVEEYNDDADFVSNIMEALIENPTLRITKLEVERCNRLWKQYQ